MKLLKKQNRDAITQLIQKKCDQINNQIEALGQLHHKTPDPRLKPKIFSTSFEVNQPPSPTFRVASFFEKFFTKKLQKIQAENLLNQSRYLSEQQAWQSEKDEFERISSYRKKLVEELIYRDVDSMAEYFELRLHTIDWPRETTVDFDIVGNGHSLILNVDFPEIEMLPTKSAAVPTRGLKLSVKDLTPAKIQRLYLEHIHCIAFRLIGEAFAALPQTQIVVFSGYSQRHDASTGNLCDDYLLSVRVQRKDWLEIDFNHLVEIDVVESLNRYELRRELLRAKLKRIEPFVN